MVEVELTLRYERGRWHAAGGSIDVSHADLGALDALIVRACSAGEPARVHVRFDFAALPTWLRQYQPHYFNYVLRIGRRVRE